MQVAGQNLFIGLWVGSLKGKNSEIQVYGKGPPVHFAKIEYRSSLIFAPLMEKWRHFRCLGYKESKRPEKKE